MKKKISMLIITMLLCISSVLIVNEDVDVKATAGGGGGDNGNYSLDYDYMWFNITENLSNVVYDAYEEGEIRKGRDFGTKGDNYTADNILKPEMIEMGLENVKKIPIQMDTGKKGWKYNYKVDVIDFNLTINGNGYPFPKRVPYNERPMHIPLQLQTYYFLPHVQVLVKWIITTAFKTY